MRCQPIRILYTLSGSRGSPSEETGRKVLALLWPLGCLAQQEGLEPSFSTNCMLSNVLLLLPASTPNGDELWQCLRASLNCYLNGVKWREYIKMTLEGLEYERCAACPRACLICLMRIGRIGNCAQSFSKSGILAATCAARPRAFRFAMLPVLLSKGSTQGPGFPGVVSV